MNSKHRALNFLRVSYLLPSERSDSEPTRTAKQTMNDIATSLAIRVQRDQRSSRPGLHVKI